MGKNRREGLGLVFMTFLPRCFSPSSLGWYSHPTPTVFGDYSLRSMKKSLKMVLFPLCLLLSRILHSHFGPYLALRNLWMVFSRIFPTSFAMAGSISPRYTLIAPVLSLLGGSCVTLDFGLVGCPVISAFWWFHEKSWFFQIIWLFAIVIVFVVSLRVIFFPAFYTLSSMKF